MEGQLLKQFYKNQKKNLEKNILEPVTFLDKPNLCDFIKKMHLLTMNLMAIGYFRILGVPPPL